MRSSGPANPEQAVQNAKAAEVQLSEAGLAEIDALWHTVTDHFDNNPLM